MIPVRQRSDNLLSIPETLQYPGFEVSWAGEDPLALDQGICFGSEDGRLLFTKFESSVRMPQTRLFAGSGDPINGVAFLNNITAVTTRSEIVFVEELPRQGPGQKLDITTYNGGAHVIISTTSGKFIAPLGTKGFLVLEPSPGKHQRFKINMVASRLFNFYKVACCGFVDGSDVLTFALRKDGWATVIRGGGSGSLKIFRYPELDVVDVCSIASDQFPHSAMVLGHDRSIYLIQNVTSPSQSSILRIDDLQGIAHKVMSSCGHIILLTSESLYILPDLARQFLEGQRIGGHNNIYTIHGNFADAFVVYNKWIFLVMPDGGLRSVKIEDLVVSAKNSSTYSSLPFDSPKIPFESLNWLSFSPYELTFSEV